MEQQSDLNRVIETSPSSGTWCAYVTDKKKLIN